MPRTPARLRILSDQVAVLADRRRVAPRHFAASIDEALPGISVEIEIEISDAGQPACSSITARAAEGSMVTGEALRRIPIARLTREATDEAATAWRPMIDPAPAESEAVEIEGQPTLTLHGAGARRLGARLTDDHYAEVASIYRQAMKAGAPPKRAVADVMGVSEPTAGRYVMEARKRGLLGPTTPGRAGEQSTRNEE